MTDDKRVVYCLKLWIKEIQKSTDKSKYIRLIDFDTCNNGILNGTYCSDEEYNEYLLTGYI